jgi:hypothetical protein
MLLVTVTTHCQEFWLNRHSPRADPVRTSMKPQIGKVVTGPTILGITRSLPGIGSPGFCMSSDRPRSLSTTLRKEIIPPLNVPAGPGSPRGPAGPGRPARPCLIRVPVRAASAATSPSAATRKSVLIPSTLKLAVRVAGPWKVPSVSQNLFSDASFSHPQPTAPKIAAATTAATICVDRSSHFTLAPSVR